MGASWASLSFRKLQESRVNKWSLTLINIIYVDYCVVWLDALGRLPADWTGTGAASWGLVISSIAGIRENMWKPPLKLNLFWGWKAMHRDNNSKWQTAIHNMGCCVLILNVGGWPPHPLLRGTVLWVSDFNQNIGIGNVLEWFKGGITTWAALSQAAARALESCAAMLAYSTTHLPPANGPNMSASCSHKSTLEISNQENTWKYHMLTPSRNMRAV